jgi:2-amino-4-hydroxy-6-hydroxymethyldihydropteridine diphosphokinase
MAQVLLALGANLGSREETFALALQRLNSAPGTHVAQRSTWQETVPVGGPAGQPLYLNGAALLETTASPQEALALLREIERDLGRARDAFWGPRTLDLDLLMYDERACFEPDLQLPHRWLPFRGFVLDPAVEIAAEWRHPVLRKCLRELQADFQRYHPALAISGAEPLVRLQVAVRLGSPVGAYICMSTAQQAEIVAANPQLLRSDPPPHGWPAETRSLTARPLIFIADYTAGNFPSQERIAVYRALDSRLHLLDYGAVPRTLVPKARLDLRTLKNYWEPASSTPEQHWNFVKSLTVPTLRVCLDDAEKAWQEMQAVADTTLLPVVSK